MRTSPRVLGTWCAVFVLGFVARSVWGQEPQQDALKLFPTENVRVIAKMNPDRRSFTNYVFWNAPFWDRPSADSSFFVHPPDTIGWHPRGSTTPRDQLSRPVTGGRYTGSIDRTIQFTVSEKGRVGVGVLGRPTIRVRCDVIGGRENLTGQFNIGAGYTPDTPIGVVFNPGRVELGFTVSFSTGLVDSNAVFKVGAEAFEGFHVYRGTCPVCGRESDLSNIGEVSREEAFRHEPFDSVYFDGILPALRSHGVYTLPEPVPGLGSTIDIRNVHPAGRLAPDEYIWVDRNAFNGFTYYYLVTTFDKGYNVGGTSQGIAKFDNCQVTQRQNCPCTSQLVSVSTKVEPLWDLPRIYAVPNPYRSGSSQNTTANYHNFPDDKLRFVNVPKWCRLKIYTVAGDLVREFQQDDGPTGVIEWDTKNSDGVLVASGVYIYRVEAKSGSWMYGRIIIIR